MSGCTKEFASHLGNFFFSLFRAFWMWEAQINNRVLNSFRFIKNHVKSQNVIYLPLLCICIVLPPGTHGSKDFLLPEEYPQFSRFFCPLKKDGILWVFKRKCWFVISYSYLEEKQIYVNVLFFCFSSLDYILGAIE